MPYNFWPNVILHVDGDAFFTSVHQAVNPQLKGKPMVAGSERGLATAVSYEAKKYGIKRCMLMSQIKRLCPQCLIVPSDYELYSLFSHKMFTILRKYTPIVEEYSIDEAFGDLKGLRRPLGMSYELIGKTIKEDIEKSLGISVSVGISITKSLAKLASNFRKPSGLTVVQEKYIDILLKHVAVGDVWGIGPNTTAYLQKLGVKTASDFAHRSESFIQKYLTKPFYEIWQELNGKKIYALNPTDKSTYKSMEHTGTFSPSTNDKHILWAKLLTHIEQVFKRSREFHYVTGKVHIFLKTQQFNFHSTEIKLTEKTAYPYLIRKELKQAFEKIYKTGVLYRAAGCSLTDLEEPQATQISLFNHNEQLEEKAKKIYPLYEQKKIDFGSTLFDKSRLREIKKKKQFAMPIMSIQT